MVLPSKGFRGFVIVELAITLAPVDYVSVKRRPISLYVDEFMFGVRNCWKRLVQQFFAGMAVLFSFLVKYLERSVLHIV